MTEKVLENGSQEIFARMLLEGEEHFAQGRMVDALHCFAQITREAGDDSLRCRAFNNMGVVAYSMDDMERAERMFMMALNIDPLDVDAVSNLSAIHKAKELQVVGTVEEPEVIEPESAVVPSDLGGGVEEQSVDASEPAGQAVECVEADVPADAETMILKPMQGGGRLSLEIPGGVRVCVPNDMALMTPYVLLEQEDWFEDEISFVRRIIKPGMNVLDIGAGYGVYALTMAGMMQGEGSVVAFEPATAFGDMLEQGIEENGLGRVLTLIRAGISDHQGQEKLSINPDRGLDCPSGNELRETIRLMTLDGIMKKRVVSSGHQIDFIRLGAEAGAKALKGGKKFFMKNSPLIMFGARPGATRDGLIQAFKEMGMDIYRLIPGLNALMDFDAGHPMGEYQLNLFACRKSQVENTWKQYFIESGATGKSRLEGSRKWQDVIAAFPYAQALISTWKGTDHSGDSHWDQYERAINACLSSMDERLPATDRYLLLKDGRDLLLDLQARGDDRMETTMSLVRALVDLGERQWAIRFLRDVVTKMNTNMFLHVGRPFLPPMRAFDRRPVVGAMDKWLQAVLPESLEKLRAFSSYFHDDFEVLRVLMQNPDRSVEMDRRVALLTMKKGEDVSISADSRLLREAGPDHLNGDFWRTWIQPKSLTDSADGISIAYGEHYYVDQNAPLLSFSIPTYNRFDKLKICLETLQGQLEKVDFSYEIVISDNDSDDNTKSIPGIFGRLNIKYIQRDKNYGAQDNGAFAISQCTGRYICPMCDDDSLNMDKLIEYIKYLENNKDVGALYAPAVVYDPDSKKAVSIFGHSNDVVIFETKDHRKLLDYIFDNHVYPELGIFRNFIVSKCLFRTSETVYEAYIHPSDILCHSKLVFVFDPYYYWHVPQLKAGDPLNYGHVHAMHKWDRFRGGVEYIFSSIIDQLTKKEKVVYLEKINHFTSIMISLAIRLRYQHNVGTHIELYYMAKRVKAMGYEHLLPIPFYNIKIIAAVEFLSQDNIINFNKKYYYVLGNPHSVTQEILKYLNYFEYPQSISKINNQTFILLCEDNLIDINRYIGKCKILYEFDLLRKFELV